MPAPRERKPVIVAISGASGACYALRTLSRLLALGRTVHVTASKAGRRVLHEEADLPPGPLDAALRRILSEHPGHLFVHDIQDVGASIASGSFDVAGMAVVPCSVGTLARIASGVSINLVDRAADVMLKERRPLVLLLRETPLSLLHIENMAAVTRAGAVVMPASPGFYSRPASIDDLVDFLVARVLDHLGVSHDLGKPWTGKAPRPGEEEGSGR